MTEKPINLTTARNLLRQAVETQGDSFVYMDLTPSTSMSCMNVPLADNEYADYVPADSGMRKTGCLVGTAMKLSEQIDDMEQYRYGTVDVFRNFLTPEAETYFGVAQGAQDYGSTWGQAFRAAEAYANAYNRFDEEE